MSIEKTAILLTAHPKQQKWWESVLLSLENYPGPLILSYDDIDVKPIPWEMLVRFGHVMWTGYPFGELKQARGEIACIYNGMRAVKESGAEYLLKIGFDEPIWRWRNIAELIEDIEGGYDCVSNGTRLIFGKAEILIEAWTKYPIEQVPQKPAEAHWRGLIKQFGIKNKRIEDYEFWRRLLGVNHLQGEYAANIGKPNSWSWTIGEIWPRQN